MGMQLHRIDPETQARLDELMRKNTEGILAAAERKKLTNLGETIEHLSLENARMLVSYATSKR